MKRKIMFLITVALVISLSLAACQNNLKNNMGTSELDYEIGDTGGLELPLTDSSEEIRMIGTTDVSDINDKYVIQKIREITGVNLKIDAFPIAGGKEKLATMIAAKNIPDIMGTVITDETAMDLAAQGAIASVEDYMDLMPNFRKIYVDNEENSWVFKSYAGAGGKLYGVYGYDWQRDVNHGMLYRKDIFDKHNIPMWSSPDELYGALKKLKEIYPDSSPYASKIQAQIFNRWSTSWGIWAQRPYYDEVAKIWKFTDTDPQYKEMLDFMKKMYDEKLIDPEFMTMTEAAWTSKMTKAELSFVTFDWIGRLDQFVQIASESTPDYDLRYANPPGPKQTIQTLSKVAWAKYVAQSKNSEIAFKLLDFLLSPAGAELITMGIKGETYELDDNNMARYLGFGEGQKLETKDLENKYGMFLEGMYMRFDRRSSYFQFTPREQEAQEYSKNPARMEPMDPILQFTEEEKAEIVDININLIKACEEFSTKYVISSEMGDAAWNAWLEQAESLGVSRLIEIQNRAQERYDAL